MRKGFLKRAAAAVLSGMLVLGTVLVPSNKANAASETLLNTYGSMFGYSGTCINYSQLANSSTLSKVKQQYNSITLENEMKPDALLGYSANLISVSQAKSLGYYIPSNYKESYVPKINFDTIDKVLKICYENGLKVRAHTLVWHSQTPSWFFKNSYNGSNGYVSSSTMDARMEFYIKSVINHVYNSQYGSVVYCWDVVNEYLHATNSGWEAVYGKGGTSPAFVKKAFQYAYDALKGFGLNGKVSLFYNDFNTYMEVNDVISLVKYINSSGKICNGVGMQSHLATTYPSVDYYMSALKSFVNAGFEVQITELDVTNKSDSDLSNYLYSLMKQVVALKKNGANITGITHWGLGDDVTWITGEKPLMFSSVGKPKSAYYSVIQAYKDAGGKVSSSSSTTTSSSSSSSSSASTVAGTISDGWYYIKNVNAQKYLTVTGNKGADGTNVEISTGTGVAGQKWYVTNKGNGYITLKSALGYMLDLQYGSSDNGANIQIYSSNGADAQIFKVVKSATSGAYCLTTKVTSDKKALDVYNFGTSDGTNVCQWDYADGSNQQWYFEATSYGTTSTTTTATTTKATTTTTNDNSLANNTASSITLSKSYSEYQGKLINNPLVTYKYLADPTCVEYNGRLYVYGTTEKVTYDSKGNVVENKFEVSTISVISSADLVNWTDEGEIDVKGITGWANNSWAPSVTSKTVNGKTTFYLYFANGGNGIGVLTSNSPVGGWKDPLGKALITRSTSNCSNVTWLFDPAVFVDDDGTGYLAFGGGVPDGKASNPKTSRIVKLGSDMISLAGTPQTIDAPYLFEDSELNKINGKYVYSYCRNWNTTDGTSAQIAYMVSSSPLSGYQYKGIIVKNPGSYFGSNLTSNNHHKMFQFKGQWYILYHTLYLENQQYGTNQGYRSLNIDKLNVSSDGKITATMTYSGVSAVSTLNAYSTTNATTMAWNGGIKTGYDSKASSMVVDNATKGNWIGVSNVAFGSTGANKLTLKVSTSGSCKVDIWVDGRNSSTGGTYVGSVNISSGSGYREVTGALNKVVTGTHDVYFIIASGSSLDIATYKFVQKSSTTTTTTKAITTAATTKATTAATTKATTAATTKATTAANNSTSGIAAGTYTAEQILSNSAFTVTGNKTSAPQLKIDTGSVKFNVKANAKITVTYKCGSSNTSKTAAIVINGNTSSYLKGKASQTSYSVKQSSAGTCTITAKQTGGTTAQIISIKVEY